MTSPDAALAAPPDACSACGGPLDSLGRCKKCGAVFGEAYRCPHCQALSDVESDQILYYRCRSCGAPRIPPIQSVCSAAEVELLKRARVEQLRAAAFRAGAGFALGAGALSLIVTGTILLVISATPFATGAALVASLTPFALAFFAQRRSRDQQRALNAALEQAWFLAASRWAAEHGEPYEAAQLAEALRVDETRAQLLLAEVNLQTFVQAPYASAGRLRVTERAEASELGLGAAPARARTDASKP